MKAIFCRLQFVFLFTCATFLFSCSDDDIITNEIGSKIEWVDGKKVTSFTLPNNIAGLKDSVTDLIIALESIDGQKQASYNATVTVSTDKIMVKMHIPDNQTVKDGEYNLFCHLIDGEKLPVRFNVIFKNEMLHFIHLSTVAYKYLSGDGTELNPYIIADADDFNLILLNINLYDTINKGRGSYFKQTASFNAPASGELDGRGYESEPFAGNYDGNNFTISGLNYTGGNSSTADVNIGLFDELLDGASISNLVLDVAIDNVYQNCGAVAGRAYGNVILDSISIIGNIAGGSNCGGLIGYASGNISVSNLFTDLKLSCNTTSGSAVGGAIGYVDAGSIVSISNMTTNVPGINVSIPSFEVIGNNYVGGAIGYFNGESFTVSDIKLEHTVSSSDNNVKIIYGGNEGVGGVIGHIASAASTSSIKSVKIKSPVSGYKFVGGIIGYGSVATPLTIENCQVSSVISGDEAIGGLFGELKTASNSQLVFSGENSVKVADGAAASVSGRESIGGVFGSSRCVDWTFSSDASVYVAVNITSSDVNCGGIAGYMNGTTADVTKITLNNTIYVSGKNNTGGLVGKAVRSTILGRNRFDFNEGSGIIIPQYSRFTPDFNGNINGGATTGGAVGLASEGTFIKHVSINTSIGSDKSRYNDIGGIVGIIDFTGSGGGIEDCTFNGYIFGDKSTGGIAGTIKNDGQLHDCVNYGSVSGTDHVGGVVGYADYSSIKNTCTNLYYCVNTGSVSGSTMIGGVVGCLNGRTDDDLTLYIQVKRCANYGAVSGSSDGVGGILGKCPSKRGRIYSCANHGSVSSSSNCRTGGIVGSMGYDPGGWHAAANLEIGYCVNKGTVSSDGNDSHVGGILGYQEEGGVDKSDHDSWVHDCSNYGSIPSNQEDDNGGLVGCMDHVTYVQNCVNFGMVSYGNATIGTHKTGSSIYTDNLHFLSGTGDDWKADNEISSGNISNQSEYDGFDFNNTWIMSGGYPTLRDCPFQNIDF